MLDAPLLDALLDPEVGELLPPLAVVDAVLAPVELAELAPDVLPPPELAAVAGAQNWRKRIQNAHCTVRKMRSEVTKK